MTVKIRRSIYALIAVVIALIMLAVWHEKKQRVEASAAASIETTDALPPATVPNQPVGSSVHTTITQGSSTKVVNVAMQTDKVALLKEILQANDADIVFYGRLEDQFGNTVDGATIDFNIQYENATARGNQHGQVASDGNGLFIISGYRGANLTIVPSKSGYALAATGTTFRYSQISPGYFVPDANSPTIIKLWRLQGAEQLINFDIETHVPVDSTSVTFDLQTGQQVSSGGDVTVSIQSSTKPSVRERYDWQAAIQMVAGGLIKSSDPGLQQMFQAPDTGYEPEFRLSFQKNVRPWTSRFNADFYFTSRGGQCYGKLWLEIDTDVVRNGSTLITLKGYLNAAGSRNLEINPATVTTAHP